MDDQRKDYTDRGGPTQGKSPKVVHTRNLLTDDVEILTAQKREEIYDSLTRRGLFSEKKKECRKDTEA